MLENHECLLPHFELTLPSFWHIEIFTIMPMSLCSLACVLIKIEFSSRFPASSAQTLPFVWSKSLHLDFPALPAYS